MNKQEKLKVFSWLLDLTEAYKVATTPLTWDSGEEEPNEVKCINFSTGGIHLCDFDNGNLIREFAKEIGIIDIPERPTYYEDDSEECSFFFNGVKFFWLQNKRDEVTE